MTEDMEELKSRIKLGNQKLNDAWDAICKIDHNTQKWKDEVQKWHLANEKLSTLCTQLEVMGFNDCLYIENGKKTRGCLKGLGCRVCPSKVRYWETEFDELPSGSGGRQEQIGI